MSATDKYVCTYAKCHETFSSLRLFESHLAIHDPNESMDIAAGIQESENAPLQTQMPSKLEENFSENGNESECEDDDIIETLLKLSESGTDETESTKSVITAPKETSSVEKEESQKATSVQILQISDITPKSKPTIQATYAIPMLCDRFNIQKLPNPTLTSKNIRNGEKSAAKVSQSNQVKRNASPKRSKQMQAKARTKPTILRKRKLSELNCDDLAHLLVRYQERVETLKGELTTTEKQVVAIRQLYKKRRKNRHNNQTGSGQIVL